MIKKVGSTFLDTESQIQIDIYDETRTISLVRGVDNRHTTDKMQFTFKVSKVDTAKLVVSSMYQLLLTAEEYLKELPETQNGQSKVREQ